MVGGEEGQEVVDWLGGHCSGASFLGALDEGWLVSGWWGCCCRRGRSVELASSLALNGRDGYFRCVWQVRGFRGTKRAEGVCEFMYSMASSGDLEHWKREMDGPARN